MSSNLIATPRGNRDADGNQAWAVVRGHEIDGEVLCEDLSERDAKLFAAAEELLAACEELDRAIVVDPDSGKQIIPCNRLLQAVCSARAAIAKAKGGAQ